MRTRAAAAAAAEAEAGAEAGAESGKSLEPGAGIKSLGTL